MERNNVDSNDDMKLYLAALSGDWKSVDNMSNFQRKITDRGETILHIAAVANRERFVKNLVDGLTEENLLTAVNDHGNTALNYAAASGNVNIAKAMLERNHDLANLGHVKPLFVAASLGHSKMVWYLYTETKAIVHGWDDDEQDKLFITCVEGNLYGIAMEMLKDNNNLARARKENGETVLHVLVRKPSAFVSETRPWLKLKQENSNQASELFKKCLQEYRSWNSSVIESVMFDAAQEVEKVASPGFKEMKNKEGDTPYVLFEKNHEELRTKGKQWVIDTANYSTVFATLICSTMFSGLLADRSDRSSEHHFAFSVASAISLFSSSASLVMFLSIPTSRYDYKDFVLWLPLRLLIGITSLCISLATMMVAFFISFMLVNHNGKELPVIFAVIGLFAIAPIIYGVLKWYLFVDIARSIFPRSEPRQRLLYKEVSHDHEPASSAIESAPPV